VKVAFVVQRCGTEVAGGAERLCLQIAQHMSRYWQIEILTTCARDYMEWQNYYPPGIEQIGETIVRRFPVDHPRDVASFNRLSAALRERQATSTLEEQEEWMRAQGPISTPLLDYIRTHSDDYDIFIFFGYLYATTYFGLPLVGQKAYLAPLAHDEWPIYFSMFDSMFAIPRAFIFNTQVERDFLRVRFPGLAMAGDIIAVGVERGQNICPEQFRLDYNITGPFILYLGRVDESKGCRELLSYFRQAKQTTTIPHELVLIGEEVMEVGFHDDIISLGIVAEQDKWNALRACDWFVMPSQFESLSIAILEAWLSERPVLVNGRCAVLQHQCQHSNGGLWYNDYSEWIAAITALADTEKQHLGRQGRRFTEKLYSWNRVEQAYLRFVDTYSCEQVALRSPSIG
jgi:glycosyltransferase involved in cell wall biosynthesis